MGLPTPADPPGLALWGSCHSDCLCPLRGAWHRVKFSKPLSQSQRGPSQVLEQRQWEVPHPWARPPGAEAPNVIHTLALTLPLLKSVAVIASWSYWENKRESDHNKLRTGPATEPSSGAAFSFTSFNSEWHSLPTSLEERSAPGTPSHARPASVPPLVLNPSFILSSLLHPWVPVKCLIDTSFLPWLLMNMAVIVWAAVRVRVLGETKPIG